MRRISKKNAKLFTKGYLSLLAQLGFRESGGGMVAATDCGPFVAHALHEELGSVYSIFARFECPEVAAELMRKNYFSDVVNPHSGKCNVHEMDLDTALNVFKARAQAVGVRQMSNAELRHYEEDRQQRLAPLRVSSQLLLTRETLRDTLQFLPHCFCDPKRDKPCIRCRVENRLK